MERARRRAERGSSMIEVLMSGALLSIGVVGVAGSVVYQQNLEASTARLWEATGEAAAQIETLRAASDSNWSGLKSNHDGRTVETRMRYVAKSTDAAAPRLIGPSDYTFQGSGILNLADGRSYPANKYSLDAAGHVIVDGVLLQVQTAAGGVSNLAGNLLVVRVNDDPDALDDGELMWADGATAPSFYAVEVAPASASGEFGRRLALQTYMADHGSLNEGTSGLLDESSIPFEFDNVADALDSSASSVVVSGTSSETVRFTMTNNSARSLTVKHVKVQIQNAGSFQEVTVAGTSVYDGTAVSTINDAFDMTLPSGDFDVRIDADPASNGGTPFDGATVSIRFTFSDNSQAEVSITP